MRCLTRYERGKITYAVRIILTNYRKPSNNDADNSKSLFLYQNKLKFLKIRFHIKDVLVQESREVLL